ncbi:hypothetical protein IWX92DRAFT_373322 [Phyllosticta citricarpa]
MLFPTLRLFASLILPSNQRSSCTCTRFFLCAVRWSLPHHSCLSQNGNLCSSCKIQTSYGPSPGMLHACHLLLAF